jgi:hypothetical protein
MSYMNGPRINFWGGGSTNVCTANNTGNCIVDLADALVLDPRSDDELIAVLRTASTNKGQNYYTEAGWNYYGDHQVAFNQARVSSSGAPGAVSTSGEMVGLPVYLLGSVDPLSGEGPYGGGVMVDLDPTSSQSTQIYVGGLQIGGEKPALLVRANTRCHSHFLGLRYDRSDTPPHLSPGSVFANGTFQIGFPREAIVSQDPSYTILSSIIDAPGAIGIVLRFCMFEFMPGLSTDQIQANYAANYNDANPSLGRIIGSIGPWFANEPATAPIGRLLQNTTLGGAQGVAFLDAAAGRLTLDLSSALQAQAIRTDPLGTAAPIGPNVDYGDLRIGTAQGVLATTPSLPETYYQFGGVYDVALDAAAVATLQKNPITIGSTQNGLSIVESPVRIYGDDRNVYLDDVGGKTTLDLLIRYLGGPLPSDMDVALSTDASGTLPDPFFLSFPTQLAARAGTDRLSIPVSDNGGPAGFLALNLQVGDSAPYFVNFRKYPQDDYGEIVASGPVPWDFVYATCLRYYYLLFPAMSKRIPLNDQATISAVGGEILKRLSPPYRDTTLRMPLTRSMSPGKVALLAAYLGQPQGAGAAMPMLTVTPLPAGTEEALEVIGNKLT